MRQYKFRGKDSNGNWRYGHLLTRDIDTGRVYIREMSIENVPPRYTDYEVDPESVGQCVGIKDKNDSDVYENDIYRRYNYFYQIVWDESIARFEGVCVSRKMDFEEGYEPVERKGSVSLYWAGDGISEIVGNSIDNPEIIQTEVQ